MVFSPVHALVLHAFLLASVEGNGNNFLGAKTQINAQHLREELSGVLSEMLGNGHGIANPKLDRIREVIRPLFSALPKNAKGRISAPVMRYAVRRYFSQRHAWIVKGFEPHADNVNVSTSEDANILQSKAPGYIRFLLEERFAREGFALDDLVAMMASLEWLAFDEVIKGVELAYSLNDLETTTLLTKDATDDLLASYLMIEMLEAPQDKEQHKLDKAQVDRRYPNWQDAKLFLLDVVGSDSYERMATSNPFKHTKYYDFQDVVRMTQRISEEFGPWSSYECHDMKDLLSEMDVHETGRVKLADFYKASENGAWQFLEPSEFLRQNGALDESSSYLGPQVIIPNYITGMSNCITSAPYYAICCLNECDLVFQHLEADLSKPLASANEILRVVEGMPTGPNITASLLSKLSDVAKIHNGQIPIHGRLLAQWLHFVFPRECPYPHMVGTMTPRTQNQWRELVGVERESVTDEEVKQHTKSEFGKRMPSPDAGQTMWSLEEVVLPHSTLSDQESPVIGVLRVASQVGIVAAFVGILVKELSKRWYPTSDKKVQYDV